MRRFIFSGALAATTYVLGVGLTLLSYQFSPPAVSLCQLARHPEWYDQKVVKVEAPATGIYEGVLIGDANCGAEGAAAVIMVDESYKPNPEVEAFLAGPTPSIRKADIVAVGRFDKEATMGCFGPRFGIHATRVELKSRVTVEPLDRRDE